MGNRRGWLLAAAALMVIGLLAATHLAIQSLIASSPVKIAPESSSQPLGFEISPRSAQFIFHDLYLRKVHWGTGSTQAAYADDTSYYFVEYGNIPYPLPLIGLTARKYGTRINGRDGRIWNASSNTWERIGYVHRYRAELAPSIALGTFRSALIGNIGKPFAIAEDRATDREGKPIDILRYWTRDGEMEVFLLDDRVIGVGTNDYLRI